MSYEDRLYTGEKQNSRSQPGEGAVKRSEHLAKKKRGDCSPLSSVSEKKQLPCVLPFYRVKPATTDSAGSVRGLRRDVWSSFRLSHTCIARH